MPGEDVYSWSVTASLNANSDSLINWAEGQPRASVNNSARSMMAATAKYRDLLAGLSVGGSASNYAFTSGVGYTALKAGLRALLYLNHTNTGPATLNMDGIGPVAFTNASAGAFVAGDLIANTWVEVQCNGSFWSAINNSPSKVNKTGDTISGDLIVQGTLTTNSFAATGNVTVGLRLTSNEVYTNGLSLTGNGLVTGRITSTECFTSGFSCSGNAAVTGSLTVSGSFGCNDLTTHGTTCNGNENVTGQLGVSGNIITAANGFKPGGGAWADSSDVRIKNVIGNYSAGLDAVKQLQPIRYSFKGNDHDHVADGTEYIGLIAQDVEAIMPEMVTRKNGHIDGERVTDLRVLDTGALIYALVNSVQELLARIEALEAKQP
jgi:hypothetical protein